MTFTNLNYFIYTRKDTHFLLLITSKKKQITRFILRYIY